MENKTQNKSQNKPRDMKMWLIVFLAVAAFFIIGVFYRLYQLSEDSIMRMWEDHAIRTAGDISYYLTMPVDAVEFSALKINGMMENGAGHQEVLDYLREETQVYSSIVHENTTGVYGYYKGKYLDGSGWEEPEGYEPETRPWYVQALDNPDSVTLVDPFMNMQTHKITMAVARLLNDGESVVSMDVFMDGIQKIVEGSAEKSPVVKASVMDNSGFIVADSDLKEVGKNYNTEGSSYEKELFYNVRTAPKDNFEIYFNGIRCISFVEPISSDWSLVLILNKSGMFKSLYYIYVITAISLLFVFGVILAIFLHIDKKNRENEELTEEVRAIADIYMDMEKIDFLNDTMVSIKKSGRAENVDEDKPMKFSTTVMKLASETASDQSIEQLKAFHDLGSLRMRLRNTDVLSHEFLDVHGSWVRVRFFVVERDENGIPTSALLAFESIDEERRQRDNLRRLSETDMMTGIRNRESGERIVKQYMADGVKGMLCFLDVDRTGVINDDFGHGAGDMVIVSLAECMKKTFRDSDVVYRYRGDKFAAYAMGVENEADGQRIIERLLKNVNDIVIPELQGRKVTVSAGASFYPADRNDSYDELFFRAERGAKEGKKKGGNSVSFNGYI